MKKIAAMLTFSLLSPLTMAGAMAGNCPPLKPLDKVVFQVSAKQWVSTKTALLTVNVNATLSNADLVKARTDVMEKLTKIAAGEWHLTQFDRSQDSSGLEKLSVTAEARIPAASLTDIYQNSKNASKPGATYTIGSVEFKPSLDDVQQVKSQLRDHLYQLVNDELGRLNKVYTTQHYTVNRLYILDGETTISPTASSQSRQMKTMVMAAAPTSAPSGGGVAVSNEIIMSAMVEAGSSRQGSEASDPK